VLFDRVAGLITVYPVEYTAFEARLGASGREPSGS